MKRSSRPGNDNGPAQKRHHTKRNQYEDNRKMAYDEVHTYGNVLWSGTVESHGSQKIVFDCSIKVCPHNEGIKSLLPLKQLTIHIIPLSALESLHGSRVQIRMSVLCTDENTDMMSYSAFSRAIRHDRVACTVLENTPSALHLFAVQSYSSGHEDYIVGYFQTFKVNEHVLGILGGYGLLPCANLEHEELVKQITRLKEELQHKDKKLTEQQKFNQELVKMHKKEMEEKEGKHEEERNMMEGQIRDKERTITTLDRKIKDDLHGKEEMVNNLYLEFQCSICQDTMIEAHCLPSCRHTFCKFCIGQWLEEKTKCPLCKHEAGIPVPYIGFDKAIDSVIGHFGKEAKQARIDAVKNREVYIEIIHERSFLVSREESEGRSSTSEGETSEEEERVPEHSGGVSELYPPRERLTDSSDEESLSQAQEGKRLRRKQEETGTAAFWSTLPTSRPLSPSSEDEPTLS